MVATKIKSLKLKLLREKCLKSRCVHKWRYLKFGTYVSPRKINQEPSYLCLQKKCTAGVSGRTWGAVYTAPRNCSTLLSKQRSGDPGFYSLDVSNFF